MDKDEPPSALINMDMGDPKNKKTHPTKLHTEIQLSLQEAEEDDDMAMP